MSWLSILYIVAIASLISLIYIYGFQIKSPWGSFWAFFLVMFLAIWAADTWIIGAGPNIKDVYWVPPLIVGFITALILAAATPKVTKDVELDKPKPEEADDKSAKLALGTVFWLLIMVLLVVALIGLFIDV